MRIISSYHDYYDCLMDGSDPHIWKRENKTLEVEEDAFFQEFNRSIELRNWHHGNFQPIQCFEYSDWNRSGPVYHINLMLLIFCGKIYRIWQFGEKISYDFASMNQLPEWKEICQKYPDDAYEWENMWEFRFPENFRELNKKYDAPAILLKGEKRISEIELNPCLRKLEFFRKVDVTSCYQEIERFVFNDLLEVEADSPPLSDKLKARSHGFTDKYSFRREPRKK